MLATLRRLVPWQCFKLDVGATGPPGARQRGSQCSWLCLQCSTLMLYFLLNAAQFLLVSVNRKLSKEHAICAKLLQAALRHDRYSSSVVLRPLQWSLLVFCSASFRGCDEGAMNGARI